MKSESESDSRSRAWIPHSAPTLTESDAEAAARAVASGFVGSGELVKQFEERMALRLQRRNARATTTGSAALHLALLAMGVRAGDAVLLPVLVCRAVLNVVLAVGAIPVLMDVDPSTFNVTPESVSNALARAPSRPTALILVHTFGYPLNVESFAQFGIPIVEDSASALGATWNGLPAGSFGPISILSFASTKMMTTGQGGMVLTSSPEISSKIDGLMDYDSSSTSVEGRNAIGFNYGFTEIQAALGLQQLSSLDHFVARRREIAQRYIAALDDCKSIDACHFVQGHSYYRFVVPIRNSETVAAHLQSAGIDARSVVSHYLSDYLDDSTTFPGASAVAARTLSLPIYPALTDADVARIASETVNALNNLA